jgi:hypothetical protein
LCLLYYIIVRAPAPGIRLVAGGPMGNGNDDNDSDSNTTKTSGSAANASLHMLLDGDNNPISPSTAAAIDAAAEKAEDDASFTWRSKAFLQSSLPSSLLQTDRDDIRPSHNHGKEDRSGSISRNSVSRLMVHSVSGSFSVRRPSTLPRSISDITVLEKTTISSLNNDGSERVDGAPILTFDLKIIVSFFQVATSLASVLEIPWYINKTPKHIL